MQMKAALLFTALCATAASLPSPNAGTGLIARNGHKNQQQCQQHPGYRWDDNQKCCYDNRGHLWSWDNWSDEKDKCSKMSYDWDDNQKCCFDNEHNKWYYNHNDVDHKQRCNEKGYRWEDDQKCCYDHNNREWNYN